MPLIEVNTGESLLIKRLGVEYISANGAVFYIESEYVTGPDYNIAVFIDSLECNSYRIDSSLKNFIAWRTQDLAKKKKIKLKFFSGQNIEFIPVEDKNSFFTPEQNSEKKFLLDLVESKKFQEFDLYLNQNPFLINEKFGRSQESLLHYVSKIRNEEFAKSIVEFGFDIDKPGVNNETALVRCAEKGNLNVAKFLLSKGAKIDGLPNGDKTPLIAASGHGHLELVNFLLVKGADIGKRDNRNQSAIEVAQYLFHDEIVLVLKKAH